MYETLSLQPSMWWVSARFASVIDSMGLESKKFLYGFCICIKPWAQPLEDFTIFLPIITMIHYTHKNKTLSEKADEEPWFPYIKSFGQSSLSHTLELCLEPGHKVTEPALLYDSDLWEGQRSRAFLALMETGPQPPMDVQANRGQRRGTLRRFSWRGTLGVFGKQLSYEAGGRGRRKMMESWRENHR